MKIMLYFRSCDVFNEPKSLQILQNKFNMFLYLNFLGYTDRARGDESTADPSLSQSRELLPSLVK